MNSVCLSVLVLGLLFTSCHSNTRCLDIINIYSNIEDGIEVLQAAVTLQPVKPVTALAITVNYLIFRDPDVINSTRSFVIPEDLLLKYNSGQTITYRLPIPPMSPWPHLTEIAVNGDTICTHDIKSTDYVQGKEVTKRETQQDEPDFSDDHIADTPPTTAGCGLVAGGNIIRPLINNGLSYERGDLPWLVAIYHINNGTRKPICGGTLISDRHVVTAAHCMYRRLHTALTDIIIKVGAHVLYDWSEDHAVIAKPIAADIPASYTYDYTIQNDIMVLTLDKRVHFTKFIRPACLWDDDTELSRIVGSTGVVAGWGGLNKQNSVPLDEPKLVYVPIVSTIECRGSKAIFHQITSNTTLCAGTRNGDGPCAGDSGGGLYLIEDGKWRVRGIVSLSTKYEDGDLSIPCNLNEYIVYTDIAQYLPWIRSILPENLGNQTNSPITTEECGLVVGGNDKVALINNGISFERGEIPWLVAIYRSIEKNLVFICGGTLVSDRHVVTAAHCMSRRGVNTSVTELVLIKVGVHKLNSWVDSITVNRNVLEAKIFEGYDPFTLKNDILILIMDQRVKFNDYIRPACLWSGDTELSRVVGGVGVVAGWDSMNRHDVDEPKVFHAPIVSTKECRASKPAFHSITHNNTLCAGDRNGAGPCTGFAGGGLYLLDDGKWKLRGIVSLSIPKTDGDTLCNLNEYVVYTDTAQFLPWIRNILSMKYYD